ncbi:MAG: hypothetical protein NW226_00815 [Microscillaceae bacterium]|nr:hypothetical protein [Microscillaceae bacterium]
MSTNHDKIIALDIDGTVCTIEADYSQCKLMEGCLEGILKFKEAGYLIYLHTGRHINHFETTTRWLKEHKVPYDHIVFGKPVAKYYIDDRGIRFSSWEQLFKDIEL